MITNHDDEHQTRLLPLSSCILTFLLVGDLSDVMSRNVVNREEVEGKMWRREGEGERVGKREGLSIACLNLFFPTLLSLSPSRLQGEHTNTALINDTEDTKQHCKKVFHSNWKGDLERKSLSTQKKEAMGEKWIKNRTSNVEWTSFGLSLSIIFPFLQEYHHFRRRLLGNSSFLSLSLLHLLLVVMTVRSLTIKWRDRRYLEAIRIKRSNFSKTDLMSDEEGRSEISERESFYNHYFHIHSNCYVISWLFEGTSKN